MGNIISLDTIGERISMSNGLTSASRSFCVILTAESALLDPVVGTARLLADLTLGAIGLHTMRLHTGSANWAAHIVTAGHKVGPGMVLYFPDQ